MSLRDKFMALGSGGDASREAAVANHIVRQAFGFRNKRDLVDAGIDVSGRLDFSTLAEAFPDFPFRFRLHVPKVPIHRDPRCVEPARFKNFGKVPFVEALLDFAAEVPSGFTPVLVVPRKGVTLGLAVYASQDARLWRTGAAWMWRRGTSGVVVAQTLRDFVKGLSPEAGSRET